MSKVSSSVNEMKEKVLAGIQITKEEALKLASSDLSALCNAADEIRQTFCGNGFDLCTIINAKSGRCTENCKFCAQSICYRTEIPEYPYLPEEDILKQAIYNDEHGVLRFSIVTSGKKLSDDEIEKACSTIKKIRSETNISVCVSMGLLNEEQFRKLKEAGASRVHNNLETSEKNFHNICITHTYQDKIEAINAAKRAGLSVCSGGIMGLGETMEDRIDMAISLRELSIKSVPINVLHPIPGTPFENNPVLEEEEIRRIIAIYRFILPDISIRLAGGRDQMEHQGTACFMSGANAAITGDYLTTAGIGIEKDKKIIKKLGFKLQRWDA